MNYLSVCSGIEAATVAWKSLGWKPVAFSEIDTFPSAVLSWHYPDIPNWGDMNLFERWPNVEIDLLCGGTPCQSFSIAGLRKGLDDSRGNLTLTFVKIAKSPWDKVKELTMFNTASLVSEASTAPKYSYEYDNATQVLYQKDEEGKIVHSIMIPKSDIEKLSFVLWVQDMEESLMV